MSKRREKVTRIIACGVFKPAIRYLRLGRRYPALRVTYLPPVLHTRPHMLEQNLKRTIASAKRRGERLICLYGSCFPQIESVCRDCGVEKVPGHNCYEILLGTQLFTELLDETAGTYFLEKDLVLNFKEYCADPLELDDDEIRKTCFEHYKRLLYIRQPGDPDLIPQANEIAHFLELSLTVSDADYSHLEDALVKLV